MYSRPFNPDMQCFKSLVALGSEDNTVIMIPTGSGNLERMEAANSIKVLEEG